MCVRCGGNMRETNNDRTTDRPSLLYGEKDLTQGWKRSLARNSDRSDHGTCQERTATRMLLEYFVRINPETESTI